MQAGRRGVGIAIAALVVALTSACGVTYRPGPPAADHASGPSSAAATTRVQAAGAASVSAATFDQRQWLPMQSSATAAADFTPAATNDPTAPPASTPSGTPDAVVPPASTASPTPTPSQTPPAEPAARDKLQSGDRGEDVKALQERLNSLGYLNGTPDGAYGGLTQQAVYALQKAAGLDRDGVAGAATLQAAAAGVRPSARTTGDAVEIDLDRQLLMVVRAGKIVATFNTSTGSGVAYTEVIDGKTYRGDAQTYRGTFSVYREVDGPDKAPLGMLYRSKYFDGGIAVHGAPYVPPYPASHGCARLTNWAQDLIWDNDWMPLGSTVVVY